MICKTFEAASVSICVAHGKLQKLIAIVICLTVLHRRLQDETAINISLFSARGYTSFLLEIEAHGRQTKTGLFPVRISTCSLIKLHLFRVEWSIVH